MKLVKASVCLGVMLALSACSEQESAEGHLENAKAYITQNKVNESIIELKNAIRADIKNAEARFLLGNTYLNLGDGLSAVKELERAYSLKYPVNKVVPLLARAYILTDADDEVLLLSDTESTLQGEEKSHYLAYKTLAALRSENLELAKASASLAHENNSTSLYTLLAQAYLQLAENNLEQAKTLAVRILSAKPETPDALMLQGQIATAMKDFSLASESFEKFLAVQPRSGIAQLLLADALLKSGQYKEAESYADGILSRVSEQPFANYIKAIARFQDKDYEQASVHAEKALSNNFGPFNLKLVAGASAFYLKNWEQSHNHLSPIIKYLPNDHQARRMLAVSQLELGLVDDIGATLGDFENNSSSDDEFLASLSFKLLELGATDEAKKLIEQSHTTLNPDAKQNARQGILKLMMNDPSGLENLKEAVELNPELVEAELALAFASLAANDIEQAKSIALKWQEKYPEKAGGFNLMASVKIKAGDYAAAEEQLTQSLSKEKDNIFALTEQLRIARIQKNEALSKQRADYIIKLYPNNNKVLRHYFGVYRDEQGLEAIKQAFEQDKADIKKGMLLSEALVALEQLNKASNVLSSFENNKQLPKRFWQLSALIYKQQGNTSQVALTLEKWLKASPYHIEPVVLLADIYAGQRKYDRAVTLVNRALDQHVDNTGLKLIKMQLLLDSKQTALAKQLYAELAVTDISDTVKEGLLGRVLLLEGKYTQAQPKLARYYQAYPTNKNIIYLAGAQLGNNEKADAIATLESHLKANPNAARIKTTLASLYLGEDDSKAIETYKDIAINYPENVIVNNNLAWLYLEKNELELALKHAEIAIKFAPEVANVVDTYGQILLKKGDNRAALKQASKAYELTQGKDIDIKINYIETLIMNKRMNEAETLIKEVSPKTAAQRNKLEKLTKHI